MGEHVVLEMDTDKPYTYYSDHKKKYPPGQAKKNKSNKWADKGEEVGMQSENPLPKMRY